MAILGLDAINRFFDILSVSWKSMMNFWAVIGLVIVFVVAQGLTIWMYTKILKSLMNLKPKVELFIRRVMLFFD
jgi:hypothetical protein